jgi:hypothetical protein
MRVAQDACIGASRIDGPQSFGAGLRYVDVEDLQRSNAGLMVGAEIRDPDSEKVGELDGFVERLLS